MASRIAVLFAIFGFCACCVITWDEGSSLRAVRGASAPPPLAVGGVSKVRGLRFDPGFLYLEPWKTRFDLNEVSHRNARGIARQIMREVRSSGVNALFVYAASARFGTYWPHGVTHLPVEPNLGRMDLLKALVDEAEGSERERVSVIAVLPSNGFEELASSRPDWRELRADGAPHEVSSHGVRQPVLAAAHPGYRNWMKGLVRDLVERVPGLSGVELLASPTNPDWKLVGGYHPETLARLSPVERSSWSSSALSVAVARSQVELSGDVGAEIHRHGLRFFASQTWTANPDGAPFSSREMEEQAGVAFDALLDLPPEKRPDALLIEVLWQQWRSEYGDPRTFVPEWTRIFGQRLQLLLADRASLVIHVEPTAWGEVEPTVNEFARTLDAALAVPDSGLSVYDFHQVFSRAALRAALVCAIRKSEESHAVPSRHRVRNPSGSHQDDACDCPGATLPEAACHGRQ